eukprot:m.40586 g.40586  ORF g.40586 m.40586 type:complete len:53 (+) comp9682_c0_seq1:1028-1186(+)
MLYQGNKQKTPRDTINGYAMDSSRATLEARYGEVDFVHHELSTLLLFNISNH